MVSIGLDLDNTIIDYSNTFYEVALEKKLIPKDFSKKKNLIKKFFHDNGQYDIFTELQGEVYGKQIIKAKIYSGFREFIDAIHEKESKIYIVSHKTKYPIIGNKYDLHRCALNFLKKMRVLDNKIIQKDNIFFETTVDRKIKRIIDLKLDVFVDDLPKILLHKDFPNYTKKILIDYSNSNRDFTGIIANQWNEVFENIFDLN